MEINKIIRKMWLVWMISEVGAKEEGKKATMKTMTIFNERGEIWTTKGQILLVFDVDLKAYHEHCEQLGQAHEDAVGMYRAKGRMTWRQTTAREGQRACRAVAGWPTTTTTTTTRTRDKRQVGAVLGTMFGVAAVSEVIRLHQAATTTMVNKGKIRQNTEDMLVLNMALEELSRATDSTEKLLELRLTTMEFAMQVEAIARGLNALNRQHLTTDLVATELLEEVWPKLLWQAKKEKGELPVHFPWQLYELPASFLTTEDGIRVTLHVPVVDRRLQLKEWMDFPVAIEEEDKHHVLAARVVTKEVFLGVDGESSTHIVLSEDEWGDCWLVGQQRVCTRPITYRTDLADTCVGALFVNDGEAVRARCRLVADDRPWALEAIGGGRFAAFAKRRLPIQIKCANGSITTKAVHGVEVIEGAPGCTVTSDRFAARTSDAATLFAGTVHRPTWEEAGHAWSAEQTRRVRAEIKKTRGRAKRIALPVAETESPLFWAAMGAVVGAATVIGAAMAMRWCALVTRKRRRINKKKERKNDEEVEDN